MWLKLAALQRWLTAHPLQFYLGATALGLVLGTGIASWRLMQPQRLAFSYATTNCLSQLAILPGLYRSSSQGGLSITYQAVTKVGPVPLLAHRACFVPTAAPAPAVVRVRAGWLGWLFPRHYEVAMGEPPRVLADAPSGQSLGLGEPLELNLSGPDVVYQYRLVAAGSPAQPCTLNGAHLACDVTGLALKQGAAYQLTVERLFAGKPAGAMPVAVTIWPAVQVVSASFKPDEIVYTRPAAADITVDKSLKSAAAKLEPASGGPAIASRVSLAGTVVHLSWDADLPREQAFRLTLMTAVATDGSSLEAPYVLTFHTSGGPKVVSTNLGSAGVDPNARITVTFDQPLAGSPAASSLASAAGTGVTVSQQGNQVTFALHDAPRCGVFTLAIAKGLMGTNGLAAAQGWSGSARASCRLTKTIGYSVKGRPIQAYFYGTGGTTILFTGGIHGDEPSGSYIMQDWAGWLDANAFQLPADKQVVVVPALNPDGLAANQRYNAHNVNVDRNFDTSDWIANISLTNGQVLPNGGGVTRMSEPETQAIAALTSSLHVRAEFSFHSQGSLVGANKVADSVAIGSQYAAAVHYATMFYNPETIMGYTLTGEYETWMGEQFGIPAVLIELPTHTGRYFAMHQAILWAMTKL
ncbi:MAG TPA: DUF2817 domain-containing protein [Candidatus Saccharimonadia bacterium]